MEVFGSSGVRGIALKELTPAETLAVAQAASAVYRDRFDATRVAVGRDTRSSGEMFATAVSSGVMSTGCAVDDIGICPTPTVQAYCDRETVPGIIVTASHNPPKYNGIKLCGPDGVELTRETIDAVESRLDTEPSLTTWHSSGAVTHVESARRRYQEEVTEAVDADRIADANLTIVLDPGHGAGCVTSPELFRELGCTVKTLNANPDGRFPGRNPEPVAENLTELCRAVRTSDADLGIAHDGDGDRAMFVDETGSLIDGDAALAALADAELSPGDTVVSAVNASQILVDAVDDADASLELTPIGSTYIITAIRELLAEGRTIPIAGEGNGGIILPDFRIARDGAYTAARFCELLVDRTASELVAPFNGYEKVRHDLAYADESERAAMIQAIEETAGQADVPVETTDGYRLDYGDGWVLARPSGTEPVIRVYAEAREAARAAELAESFVSAVENAIY